MIFLSRDAAAAIANLAKGVVEVTAIETHPISAGVHPAHLFLARVAHKYYLYWMGLILFYSAD
jgi:hypothetical protein